MPTCKNIIIIGINIVINTKIKSIQIALFFSTFVFLLNITEPIYKTKLIILELNILEILAEIRPVAAEKETVNNSGTEVATPAILPTVFAFKLNVSANFLKSVTKIYLDIITINAVNTKK